MSDLLLAFDALDARIASEPNRHVLDLESARALVVQAKRIMTDPVRRPTPILVTEAMAQAREQGGMDRGQFRLAAVQNQT